MYEYIASNIDRVKERIKKAAERSGRSVDDIVLIAVTKTVDVERIKAAVNYGIKDLGENRVQELTAKYPYISDDVRWHMIGRLQTNKVKYIIDRVSLIHSVDSLKLLKEIDKRSEIANRMMDILIEVNVAGEASKGGVAVEDVIDFVKQSAVFENIRIKGLMTVAPQTDDPEIVRPYFAQMKELSFKIEKLKLDNVEMKYLSMGMSGDFEVAIEEGSNMVRIGTAIFGERPINT
ncbi:YggS family pyridoxal phosphate-dependent enzyme [Mahella australiensis]|uniref:Pyridoxal phosphate homeostasis protein n=1 Tax=Mahella australiensis (strain DSM 15567 / CIP 107919 / 50-1 BON) TaxID=697281 RepID=F3ZX80_MAHA5|nr:YggS family pyridoxal phosphate-dependent enzyme [Mahella australiensis]AEE96537.1 alanine racemase domain protein [Mahella australiensis 50-1 BON]